MLMWVYSFVVPSIHHKRKKKQKKQKTESIRREGGNQVRSLVVSSPISNLEVGGLNPIPLNFKVGGALFYGLCVQVSSPLG